MPEVVRRVGRRTRRVEVGVTRLPYSTLTAEFLLRTNSVEDRPLPAYPDRRLGRFHVHTGLRYSTGPSIPTPTTWRQIMCNDQEPQSSNSVKVVQPHHPQEHDHMKVPVLTGSASM